MADIGAVKEILAMNLLNRGKSLVMRLPRSLAGSEHHEHPASVGPAAPLLQVRSRLDRGSHMVNLYVRIRKSLVQTAYLFAFYVLARIALRSQDKAHDALFLPLQLTYTLPVGDGAENVIDVRLQARQNDLGFRIAETAIELYYLDSVLRTPLKGQPSATSPLATGFIIFSRAKSRSSPLMNGRGV